MSTLYIKGVAYTPERKEGFRGGCLTEDEMNEELVEKCVGLPVLINHDMNHPEVGKVIDARINEHKNLEVIIHCDVDFFNTFIYSCLTDKNATGKPHFRGLSLGMRVGERRTLYDVEVVHKEPVEVSIVPVGDRPDTWITDFQVV